MKSITTFLFCFTTLLCSGEHSRFLHDDWSTHQPVLFAAANTTKGPIIEFGCGYGSTDMLHEICAKEGRLLISLDDHSDWLNRFATKYKDTPWHRFVHVPGKNYHQPEDPSHWICFLDTFEPLQSIEFDVCFIDQAPWLARYETVKRVKDKALFVIVHDVDYFARNHIFGSTIRPIQNRTPGIFDFSDLFRSFQVYFPHSPWPGDTGPPTLIASNRTSTLPAVDYTRPIVINDP
ncbi:MAG: hypothetical protein RL235_637 [Chlamydiota bacterium]|jgi:hypothetical protein